MRDANENKIQIVERTITFILAISLDTCVKSLIHLSREMLRILILLGLVVPNVLGCTSSSTCDDKSKDTSSCSKVTFKSRDDWGARPTKGRTDITVPVKLFFIHHTVTPSCASFCDCSQQVRNIQNYHMDDKGWDDIGYSFLVGGDGNVYVGRDWDRVGAHTLSFNSISFAAGIIGDFTDCIPNENAVTAVKNLIACGVELGKISKSYTLKGHRDVGATECPGEALYNKIQKWKNYSPRSD